MVELIGNAGKPRIFAMIVDNIVSTIVAVVVAASLPGLATVGRGIVACLMYLAYYFLCEGIWARTPGKWAFGLAVLRLDGSRSSWSEAAVRALMRILEVNPLLFGALPGGLAIMWSRRKQRLGDMLARTVVVAVR